MKRFLTLFVIMEMQIKIAMRYNCTRIRMAKIRKTDNINCWQQCGIIETLNSK